MPDFAQPVVVGIDGTASGKEALALGSAIGVLTGAPLILAAVYGFHGNVELEWPPRSTAQSWLDEAQEELGDIVPSSTRLVLSSSPARGLVTLARREHARMIVVGSSRRGPIGRVLVGATGRHVAHGAPCAVAIAPHDWRTQPEDVPVTFGVAFTDSAEAREALALAGSLAAAAKAPLKLITVVHPPSPAHPMFAATGTSYEKWCRDLRELAEDHARDAISEVRPEVEPEVLVLDGDPVERLVEASHDLDMLVVGSRRYGPVRSALLGSVSAPLIERAACPVIIVPRGVEAESFGETVVEEAARA